jgi:hypothetical protein
LATRIRDQRLSGWVTDFISSFGLPAVAILMVLENLFPSSRLS